MDIVIDIIMENVIDIIMDNVMGIVMDNVMDIVMDIVMDSIIGILTHHNICRCVLTCSTPRRSSSSRPTTLARS